MDLDNFYTVETETCKKTLREHFVEWKISASQDYARDYVDIFRELEKCFGDIFRKIKFGFDEYSGFAHIYELRETPADYHNEVKAKHVFSWFSAILEYRRNKKTFWKGGKSRNSHIQKEMPCRSGFTIECVFWESLQREVDAFARCYMNKRSKDNFFTVFETENIVADIFDEALDDLVRAIVDCYASDMSEENFLEYFRECSGEEIFEEKEVV